MVSSRPAPSASGTRAHPLRIGFVALTDAAPIIVAHEQGLFARHGLNVELSREVGWASIRDKILHRELDAAHALSSMMVGDALARLGHASPCLSACALSRNGNSVTISDLLWKRGVRDAATLRDEIIRLRHERPLVFGVVHLHSSHHILLCDWLGAAGISPQRDVRIVTVPPEQLFRNLSAGTLDGYCAGEPWGSLAVREGAGWCAALSCDLSPGHPEKSLMVLADFAERNEESHLALVAAIAEAALLCDQPDFRPQVCALLARREYLNLPERVLAPALVGPFNLGRDRSRDSAGVVVFGDSKPIPDQAGWFIDGLRRHRLIPADIAIPPRFSETLFRLDIHRKALRRTGLPSTPSRA